MHVLSPNIYRTTSEALESFDYITTHGIYKINHPLFKIFPPLFCCLSLIELMVVLPLDLELSLVDMLKEFAGNFKIII